MSAVRCACVRCAGAGYIHPAPPPHAWLRCPSCDGTGLTWVPGAPSFGCEILLSDRDPGEIVTLGNGDRVRILWHMPRRTKKDRPVTTFVGAVDDFTDAESHTPISVPSCVGVLSVDFIRAAADHDAHGGEKALDYNDPVLRQVAGRLL